MINNNILLVDDEPLIRVTLERMLTKKGYSVDTAESGEIAFAKCKESRYDLVISDIMMEGMSGVELLKLVIDMDPDAEVILLTGQGTLETAVEALRLGASDYLQKPCDRNELSIRAKRSLEKCELKKKLKHQNKQLVTAKKELEKALEKSLTAEKELQKSHEELETRVTARTAELSKAKAQAEKAGQAKSEFLTHMSHELRTPLNAVLGFAQLLELSSKDPLTETQKSRVHKILAGGEHLLTLINDILDLAKVESGQLSFSLENVNLGKIIGEVIFLLKPLALERNIEISSLLENEGQPVFVFADATRFKQLLLNLISNAIKYNNDNGKVTISIIENDRDTVIINIKDTGIGIADDQLDLVFEPFRRVQSVSDSIEGAGIGLAYSLNLVKKMNGKLSVESCLGQGSTFSVTIPKGENEDLNKVKEGEKNYTLEDKPSSNIFNILYIEDNPVNLQLIQSVFSEYSDIVLLSAHEALLGIEIARHQSPNLILMDINLPGMSGLEAFKKLQTWEETKNIPVIGVSANAMQEDIKSAISAGMHSYITKPINVPKLLNIVLDIKKDKK